MRTEVVREAEWPDPPTTARYKLMVEMGSEVEADRRFGCGQTITSRCA